MQEYLIVAGISVAATLAVVFFWSKIKAWGTAEASYVETALKSKFDADVAAAKATFDGQVAVAAKAATAAASAAKVVVAPVVKAVAPASTPAPAAAPKA